jgi:hypothetical protein
MPTSSNVIFLFTIGPYTVIIILTLDLTVHLAEQVTVLKTVKLGKRTRALQSRELDQPHG